MTLLNISSGFKPFHRETVVRGNEPKTVAICQITEEKITEEYKQHKLWNILEKKISSADVCQASRMHTMHCDPVRKTQ